MLKLCAARQTRPETADHAITVNGSDGLIVTSALRMS